MLHKSADIEISGHYNKLVIRELCDSVSQYIKLIDADRLSPAIFPELSIQLEPDGAPKKKLVAIVPPHGKNDP